MSTEQNDFTPPPASVPSGGVPAGTVPAASGPAPSGRAQTGTRTWITVVLSVIGGLAIVGTGATAAVAASSSLSRGDSVQRLDVTGVTSLDLDVSASTVRVLFADVDEAELAVTAGGDWEFFRDGDELQVHSPDWWFDWSFGTWFGDEQNVVLTLPSALQGIDGSFSLGAGDLEISGEFGDLGVDVSAGDLTVAGAATSLDAQLGAGSADITLDDVDEADLSVAAGELTVTLTGRAPQRITVDTSAGTTDLTVPDAGYRVVEDRSAGTIDNRLNAAPDSRNTIDVSVSAGTVTLRPGS